MAVLLSKTTAARLSALLGKQGSLPPSTNLPAGGSYPRPEQSSDYAPPFSVRYSTAQASWIIHLPPRCCVFAEDGQADVASSLTACDGMTGWYKFTGATGVVYAWVEPAAGAPDEWWGDWSTAKLSAGADVPINALAAGMFWPVAAIDATTCRVLQYAAGTIILSGIGIDGVSIEQGYDENGYPNYQIAAWDNEDNGTANGISQVLKADPESGEISAYGDSGRYELLVRVGGAGGPLGYMPIGDGDGSDPEDPNADACDQNTHPASGGVGGAGEDEDADHPADEDVEHPGEGDNGTGGDTGNTQHPASDDCYTTAY